MTAWILVGVRECPQRVWLSFGCQAHWTTKARHYLDGSVFVGWGSREIRLEGPPEAVRVSLHNLRRVYNVEVLGIEPDPET